MAPLKVGLIGSGGISRAHMPAFLEHTDEVQLTAVCDIREDAAQAYADDAGVDSAAVYTDYAQMLREADVEAVDICTIHSTHRDVAVAAARAGKHVLLEKPMATSVQECRDIIEATDEAGVTFMVAQMLRFLPHYQEARRIIQSGELGQIWAARSDSWFPAALPGLAVPSDWWGFDKQRNGGGVLIMVAVHQLDLLRYFIGDVRRVTARYWTDHPMLKNGAEDRVVATLEFANGADRQFDCQLQLADPVVVAVGAAGRAGVDLHRAGGGRERAPGSCDGGVRGARRRCGLPQGRELPVGRGTAGGAGVREPVHERDRALRAEHPRRYGAAEQRARELQHDGGRARHLRVGEHGSARRAAWALAAGAAPS